MPQSSDWGSETSPKYTFRNVYWQERSRVCSLRDSRRYVSKAQTRPVRVQSGYGTLSNTEAQSSKPEHRSKLG